MTGTDALRTLLAPIRHVLIDFDGPICSVFAGYPADQAARQLRRDLRRAGIQIPSDVEDTSDPLELFRAVAGIEDDEDADQAQKLLTDLELHAATTARPTPGARELLTATVATGRTASIVSNNAGAAITAYLNAHDLERYVTVVVGRDDHDPYRMKPNPYRVRAAVGRVGAEPGEGIFIGDTPSDVLAGHLGGVRVIGYANKPGKFDALTEAHANAVVTNLAPITAALRATTMLGAAE